jgi:agmatinase
MKENNLKHYMMQEFWERGPMPVLDDVIAEAKARAPKAYISIDIDVLDPGFAPATGTPEPGGFAPIDLLRIIRRLTLELDVVGFDVMEVAPAYDHADVTINNAHRLIWEFFAGLASKKRDAAEARSS